LQREWSVGDTHCPGTVFTTHYFLHYIEIAKYAKVLTLHWAGKASQGQDFLADMANCKLQREWSVGDTHCQGACIHNTSFSS
jgi:hypothetical protein